MCISKLCEPDGSEDGSNYVKYQFVSRLYLVFIRNIFALRLAEQKESFKSSKDYSLGFKLLSSQRL